MRAFVCVYGLQKKKTRRDDERMIAVCMLPDESKVEARCYDGASTKPAGRTKDFVRVEVNFLRETRLPAMSSHGRLLADACRFSAANGLDEVEAGLCRAVSVAAPPPRLPNDLPPNFGVIGSFPPSLASSNAGTSCSSPSSCISSPSSDVKDADEDLLRSNLLPLPFRRSSLLPLPLNPSTLRILLSSLPQNQRALTA